MLPRRAMGQARASGVVRDPRCQSIGYAVQAEGAVGKNLPAVPAMSTVRSAPETNSLSSDARNRMARATSIISPRRCVGRAVIGAVGLPLRSNSRLTFSTNGRTISVLPGPGHRVFHRALPVGLVTHVERNVQRLLADLLRHGLASLVQDVSEHYPGALAREQACSSLSGAASCAGDQSGLPVESSHRSLLWNQARV